VSAGVLPSAAQLAAEMERAVRGEPPSGSPALAGLVLELVGSNLRQWDLEDAARAPSASDAVVADAKRAIDRLNLGRHRLVQEIDIAVASGLDQPASASLATESPGMVLDRLSVLVIRRARTAAALSSGDGRLADRLLMIDAQLAALTVAFDDYLEELRAGTRRFAAYEHLKLYAGGHRPDRRGEGDTPLG
jgi:hypothetical protein